MVDVRDKFRKHWKKAIFLFYFWQIIFLALDDVCRFFRRRKKKILELVSVPLPSATCGTCLKTLTILELPRYFFPWKEMSRKKCVSAKVVAIVSCLFVVVSTLCLIFSTLPSFQQRDGTGKVSGGYNVTNKSSFYENIFLGSFHIYLCEY